MKIHRRLHRVIRFLSTKNFHRIIKKERKRKLTCAEIIEGYECSSGDMLVDGETLYSSLYIHYISNTDGISVPSTLSPYWQQNN